MRLQGKTLVVVGLGTSGRAAAALALAHGARVIAVDGKGDVPPVPGAEMELGPHRRETFLAADTLVVSPGVPAAQPDIAAAIAAGVDVVGELGFAWRFIQPRSVAITGTNGKSTVTSFVGHLLAATGARVFVGGNLGTPLSEAALAVAAGGPAPELAAIEVSSYQMELPGGFDPRAAVVLNLTPDHLARHKTMESYGEHKCRVFARMSPDDLAVIPAGDPLLARLRRAAGRGEPGWLGALPGVSVDGTVAQFKTSRVDATIDLRVVKVPGRHNLEHAATAALMALHLGAEVEQVTGALSSLVALPHRMEPVADVGGVLWINDSKGTNVDSTRVGLSGMDRPCVVLLGGEAKGPGFDVLAPALRGQRAVIAFGASGDQIVAELGAVGVEVERVGWMADAVQRARVVAQPGDAVVLSPACASFDEFRNFEHRGDVFRALATEVT